MSNVLDLALAPLPLDAADRLSSQIAELAQHNAGDGFIALWFGAAKGGGRCFTAIVLDGVVVTWNMFPCADESSAKKSAESHHAWAQRLLGGMHAGIEPPQAIACAGNLH